MGTLVTVLVVLAMIGIGVVMIHMANAGHGDLLAAARPHRWWSKRRPD
jgi:hypothetical protein